MCGDSAETLPAHTETSPAKFDAIFIDGGHLYNQALGDLRNSLAAVRPGSLVIVDDCEGDVHHPFYDEYESVSSAWRHVVGEGILQPIQGTCSHCGLCMGHYVRSSLGPNSAVTISIRDPVHNSIVTAAEPGHPFATSLVVSVDVGIEGEGPDAGAIRQNPGAWNLCAAATSVRSGHANKPSCSDLMATAGIPTVTLGRIGVDAANLEPIKWRLDAWLAAKPGNAVAPQLQVLGLTSVVVTA